MAKKQNKSGKKPMSSSELRKSISDRDFADYQKAQKKYSDRGKAGQDMISAEQDRRIKAAGRDMDLVYEYGKDAPKARTFGTDNQPSKKGYSNPPRKVRMK